MKIIANKTALICATALALGLSACERSVSEAPQEAAQEAPVPSLPAPPHAAPAQSASEAEPESSGKLGLGGVVPNEKPASDDTEEKNDKRLSPLSEPVAAPVDMPRKYRPAAPRAAKAPTRRPSSTVTTETASSKPSPARSSSSPSPRKKYKTRRCNCSPGDMMCAMRCSAPGSEVSAAPQPKPAPKPAASTAPSPAWQTGTVSGLTDGKEGRAGGETGKSLAERPWIGFNDKAEPAESDRDVRFSELQVLRPEVKGMTFQDYGVNPTVSTADQQVSTFAVDVDSASYSVARGLLQRGQLPAEAAVRVEEFINAFDFAYAAPTKEPFLVQAEVFPSPNRKGYHVLHIGVKGRELSAQERKPVMLEFVVDISGSMSGSGRLGLVKQSLALLTNQLDGRDSVGLVVYGTDAREVLRPTPTTRDGKKRILNAIMSLTTEGSTNVEAGLELAYDIAGRHNTKDNNTRIVLCSDGVANVGVTDARQILARVERQTRRGVTISTVGFGMGNYNDTLMEQLADKGNGNYAYVDDADAARTLFVDRLGATLEVIAKDVKLQMSFDPRKVQRYRLLGFENRMLSKQDFSNDRVDAGEIGAGHSVTAIYEVKLNPVSVAGDFGTLRVRYKTPQGSKSGLVERGLPLTIVRSSYADASAPTKLSMVVAAFAEKLRGSYWARNESYDDLLELWKQLPESLQARPDVAELRSLILKADALDTRGDRFAPLLPVAQMDFDRVPVLY